MNTVRNRPKVLAIVLREAVKAINGSTANSPTYIVALESIGAVVAELEDMASVPDSPSVAQLTDDVLTELQRRASRQFGNGSRWSEVQG